jgi:hypothetical protein
MKEGKRREEKRREEKRREEKRREEKRREEKRREEKRRREVSVNRKVDDVQLFLTLTLESKEVSGAVTPYVIPQSLAWDFQCANKSQPLLRVDSEITTATSSPAA